MVEMMEAATGPAVWMGSELARSDDWKLRLSAADIEELDAALAAVEAAKIPFQDITVDDFPLPGLGIRLREFAHELENGRGFGVIRGIPVEKYSEDACKIIGAGICSYVGAIIPQSLQGDFINHVIDMTDVTSATNPELDHIVKRKELRANHTGGELDWHTDTTDIIGLFCLNKAKEGGISRLASSAVVHNLILEQSPECLSALYDGYYYMSMADDNLDATPHVSAERIPVFSRQGDKVNFYYISQVVQRAMEFGNVRYNPVEHEALDQIQTAANTPGVPLEFMLEAGDLEVINNRVVMHSRQEYDDFPQMDRRRHLLRLWMAVTPERNSSTFLAPGDRT